MIVVLNEDSLWVAIMLYMIFFIAGYFMLKNMISYSKNSLSLMLVKVLFILTLAPLPFIINAAIFIYNIR